MCEVQLPRIQHSRRMHHYRIHMLALRRRPPSILKELPIIRKRNRDSPKPNQGTHDQTTGHTKSPQTKPKSRITRLKLSKEHSNRNTSKSSSTTEQKSRPESSEDNSPTVPSYGHGYYTQGKGKKKRSPPSPPLPIGGEGVKRLRK